MVFLGDKFFFHATMYRNDHKLWRDATTINFLDRLRLQFSTMVRILYMIWRRVTWERNKFASERKGKMSVRGQPSFFVKKKACTLIRCLTLSFWVKRSTWQKFLRAFLAMPIFFLFEEFLCRKENNPWLGENFDRNTSQNFPQWMTRLTFFMYSKSCQTYPKTWENFRHSQLMKLYQILGEKKDYFENVHLVLLVHENRLVQMEVLIFCALSDSTYLPFRWLSIHACCQHSYPLVWYFCVSFVLVGEITEMPLNSLFLPFFMTPSMFRYGKE